jgi:hypothetical protein
MSEVSEPPELLRRLTSNRHVRAFFKMNEEWALKKEGRVSFAHSLSELLASEHPGIERILTDVEELSDDAAERAELIEIEAQSYLEDYDPNLAGVFEAGRNRPDQPLTGLITSRAKGLRTFGEFLVNSLGISHSYLVFLKRCQDPMAQAEMMILFRRAYVVLRALEQV